MLIRFSAIVMLITVLFSYCLFSVDDSLKRYVKNQKLIDAGKNLDDRMNRLGTVIVDYIEIMSKIIKGDDWKELGINERKLLVLLQFNRPDMNRGYYLGQFRDPLRLEIYKRLSNSMGSAFEHRQELLEKVNLLCFDTMKLKNFVAKTKKNYLNRKYRQRLGLTGTENAIFEVFLNVNRKNDTISIGGRIFTVKNSRLLAFVDTYKISAEKFLTHYPRQSSKKTVNLIEIKPPDVEIKKLKVSNIYYKAPGFVKRKIISNNSVVESGGIIWFEIQLNEPGGYFLAYLEDRFGNIINLFPGTRNAVMNGDYLIPNDLMPPLTEIQRATAINPKTSLKTDQSVSQNTIVIGGYNFDEKPGIESFHFVFTSKRYPRLEAIIKNGAYTGRDLPQINRIEEKEVVPPIKQSFFYTIETKFTHK